MSPLGHGVALPVALAISGVACASVLGIEDLPRAEPTTVGGHGGTSAAPATTPVVYREAPCAACVADACFDAEVACRVDPTCSAVYACLAECPVNDPTCRWTCEAAHATSIAPGSLADALDVCRRAACLDTCFGAGGLFAPLGDACRACVDQACGAEEATCIAGRGCEREAACALTRMPPTPDADFDCEYRFDPDRTSHSLLSCYSGCAAECAVGRQFSCIDAYSWRRLADQPIAQTFDLRQYPNTALGAGGLSVRACNDTDCEACSLPLDTQTSGPDGLVTLTLPLNRGAFEGCLFVEGPGYPLGVLLLGRPIDRPQAAVRVNLPSASTLALVSAVTGVALDPARGQIIAQTWDCLLDGGRGLTFELDPPDAGATPFFLVGAKLATGSGETDANAAGGFFNVTPGTLTLRTRVAATGAILGEQRVTAIPGAVTGVQVYPRALP